MSYPMVPYGHQSIDDEDIAAVAAALRGEALTAGPMVAAFEAKFAATAGATAAVVCANGTAALHLAYLSAGLQADDIILVPSVTFLATANAARFIGAEVVFADADPHTGLTGIAEFAQAFERARTLYPGRRIAMIAPVHLNGQLADPWGIAAFARDHRLAVVEDACHALGTELIGTGADPAGSAVGGCHWSDAAVFSFHPVKTIAMGEGGAITVRDPQRATLMRCLRNHGMERDFENFSVPEQAFSADGQPNPWYYEMARVGFNYRASDIHCALGLSQLAKLERFKARRQALTQRYDRELAALAGRVRPIARMPGQRAVLHLYVVAIDFERMAGGRAAVMRALSLAGIGTQVHYLPVHRQPYYRERYGLASLPGADHYYAHALSLPLFPAMADSDVDRVVAALDRVISL